MRSYASALVAALATAFLLAGSGASDARRLGPRADVAPTCVERLPAATGRFDSNYGPVELYQRGSHIRGRYQCCGGGTIEGTLTGNVIRYLWKQPGSSGRGVWVIASTGELIGTWGMTDEVGGGAWNLHRGGASAAIVDP